MIVSGLWISREAALWAQLALFGERRLWKAGRERDDADEHARDERATERRPEPERDQDVARSDRLDLGRRHLHAHLELNVG